MDLDVVIRGGLVFDGSGDAPRVEDVAVRGGRVAARGARIDGPARREIDARDRWVTPGFLDIHTHYDAELEASPGLHESVRHGVTTVLMGNCSLSLALGEPDDLLDIFTRVENLPREVMRRWLERVDWRSAAGYYDHLERDVAMGPNVASLLGHSNVRMATMGLARSLRAPRATRPELRRMERIVAEAMDAGYVGLSIDMLPWHRMDGPRHGGVSVPSQRAHPAERARLADVVRRRGRVLQATPSAVERRSILTLVGLSAGLHVRRALKTTIVAALDVDGFPGAYRFLTLLATASNRALGADVRFQALPAPFRIYSDGAHNPVFEEFPTGVEAMSCDEDGRRRLFASRRYRRRFRRDWNGRDGVFHRRFDRMRILSAPGRPGWSDRSFAEVAGDLDRDPLELFMDLIVEHGDGVRWVTDVANGRPGPRRHLLAHPATLPGFLDSGAHARNIAFQDGPLRMLLEVRRDPSVMSVGRAVARLTREPADWLGLPAGRIEPGDPADLVVLDPDALDRLDDAAGPVEQRPPFMDGAMRLVRESPGVVRHVLIGGREAYGDEAGFDPELGTRRFGRLLRVGSK